MQEYTHSTGTFIGKGGVEIFFQCWKAKNQRGILVISHGVGEHSGRYMNIINKMKGKDISFYIPDQRGHGSSGGKRGHVDIFTDFIYDLKLFINYVKDENRDAPILLMGHSMGGVISIKYALTYPEDISGLIVSSAGLIPVVKVPVWKEKAGRFFSKYIPALSMPTGLPPEDISSDPDTVKAYVDDPLVHDKVSARWYTEFVQTSEECLNRAYKLKLPLLLFHGTEDKIVDFSGTEKLYETSSSADKELHLFNGLYHETMNEIPSERETVLSIISKWIMKHIKVKKSRPEKKKSSVKSGISGKKKSPGKKKSIQKTAKKSVKKKAAVKKTTRKKASSKKTSKKKSPKKKPSVRRSGKKK